MNPSASETRLERRLAIFLIFAAAVLRVLPHPWNLSPVAAVSLFAGATLSAGWAVAVPVFAMALSDLAIGPHDLFLVTWGAMALVAVFGRALKGRGPLAVAFGVFGGSVFFFLTTNLAVFLFSGMYTRDWEGLRTCYVLALPFFRNSLAGDLVYAAALFGIQAVTARHVRAKASAETA